MDSRRAVIIVVDVVAFIAMVLVAFARGHGHGLRIDAVTLIALVVLLVPVFVVHAALGGKTSDSESLKSEGTKPPSDDSGTSLFR